MQQPTDEKPIVTVQVSRPFRVSAEEAFDAWINPEHIAAWFAPGLGQVSAEVNPGVGGELAITQLREDGPITHLGRFQQLIHPRRLIFSWTVAGDDGEDRIIVDITPKPAGCEVVLTYEMDAEWEELVEDAETAWSVMLQVMEQHLDASQAD